MKDSNGEATSCACSSSSAAPAKRKKQRTHSDAQELPHYQTQPERSKSSKKRHKEASDKDCKGISTTETPAPKSSSSKKRQRQESSERSSSSSSSSSKPVAAAAAAAAMDDIFGDVKALKATKAREEEERLAAKAAARAERKRREVNPFAEGGGSLGGGAEPDAADRWGWADSVKPVRHDAEGLPIYSWDALRIGQGGGTDLCPFDCDCCF
jgi:Eukaryotic protein of unknown function (DUF1764)